MILHTLNATPSSSAYKQCLRFLCADDALVLMGGGVYAAMADTEAQRALSNTGATLFALQPDIAAAGILQQISSDVTIIGFDDFVALSERFNKQQAWF